MNNSRIKNAKKLLATALGEETLEDATLDMSDEVTYYTAIFPSAVPLVYNHCVEHPLASRFDEVYGDTFFLIYKPMGSWPEAEGQAKNEEEQPFYLFLIRSSYVFDKYVDFFFANQKYGGWRAKNFALRNDKIKCFGSVKLLMLNEDKDKLYSRYRNAIALAFKDGKNPVAKNKRTVSYLYHDNALIETPGFFEWDKNVDEDFEKEYSLK